MIKAFNKYQKIHKNSTNYICYHQNKFQQHQAGGIEQADENPCNILTSQSRKRKYSDAWLLNTGAHTTCAQKGSGSVHTAI